jgi:hypothetical protein
MEVIAIIIGFVVVAAVCEIGRYFENRAHRTEKQSLLDRIMARDYEQYAQVQMQIHDKASPPPLTKDQVAQIVEDTLKEGMDQGIPV